MTKTIKKTKSKILKKLAKKHGWKVKKIHLGDDRCAADLRGLPVFNLDGWNKACEAAFDAAEKDGIPIPRTAEEIMNKHITNRLDPIIANRKPWPAWPVVEATDELHKEFLSKDNDKKLHEMKEDIYFLLQRVEAQFGRHHWVSKDISVVLDKWERS